MTNYEKRHHLRLDELTQDALDQLCRLLVTTKSSLMRKYIQEGVKNDLQNSAKETKEIEKSLVSLKANFKKK